ncbi:MAG: DUF4115 domain-containing protein, partial [Candidatus Omnitrophica bacterium]|nr:DUF4115 domain-containing protein [Candidatus Omnitrophota bacterium]
MMSELPLGEKLKRARKDKGLTLEDLQKKTKVHINILKAIEGETITNLSPVYLKGFIKIYCKALDLDYKEYMPDYKEPTLKIIPKPQKSTNSFLKNAGMKLSSLKPNRRLKKWIFLFLVVIFSLILLFRISGCLFSRRKQDVPSIKTASDSSVSSTQGSSLPREASGGISLVISAKEKCLVFVKADGKVVFHRLLEKGRSATWKAKDKIELSLGNASAVELIVNGQRFTNLG